RRDNNILSIVRRPPSVAWDGGRRTTDDGHENTMPIRFRCQRCQQLMGIARRKAGTEVQCPTCREMVHVPNEDQMPAPAAREAQAAVAQSGKDAPAPKAGPLPVFERSDFDEVLRSSEDASHVRPARPASPARPERSLAAAAGRVPN